MLIFLNYKIFKKSYLSVILKLIEKIDSFQINLNFRIFELTQLILIVLIKYFNIL